MQIQILNRFDILRFVHRVLVILCLTFTATFLTPTKSYAICCDSPLGMVGVNGDCLCTEILHDLLRDDIESLHEDTKDHIQDEFEDHRNDFIVDTFFRTMIVPAMQNMTEQLVTTAMHQVFILGTFIDAEEQLATQRLLQELMAEAHKDYHPSMQLCMIGTNAKTLTQAHSNAFLAAHTLNQQHMQRQLATATTTNLGRLPDNEYKARITQFIEIFCDIHDNNGALESLCIASAPNVNRNMDINYTNLIDSKKTINFHPQDDNLAGAINGNEESIYAMNIHLFGSQTFEPIPESYFEDINDQIQEDADFGIILDVRSILAKRSVAQNSFSKIVGMKASGGQNSEETRLYMAKVLEQLGIENPALATNYLGTSPSYHAQMEMLTKTLYQRPEFFINLYDKPANVERTGAAIRAIGLMQNMDRYKSQLRSEMLLSVILETKLLEEHSGATQPSVQTRINGINE